MPSCPQITEPSLDCEPTAGEDILADPPLESQARTGFWEVERLRAEYALLFDCRPMEEVPTIRPRVPVNTMAFLGSDSLILPL